MPSPVAHSLLGLSVGLVFHWPRGALLNGWFQTLSRHRAALLGAMVVANLPDIDYVPGMLTGDLNAFHHGYTHTLGWIVLVGGGIWLCWRSAQDKMGWREAIFLFVCLLSHLLADMLTDDGSFPYGIMFFWPLTDTSYISPFPVFPRPSKAAFMDIFSLHNVRVMMVELLIALPVVLLVIAGKRLCPGRR